MLTAILGAPLHFAIDLTALLVLRHLILDNDGLAIYSRGSYHDPDAIFVLSNAVTGDIIGGLVLFPLSWLFVAVLGAAMGTRLSQTFSNTSQ